MLMWCLRLVLMPEEVVERSCGSGFRAFDAQNSGQSNWERSHIDVVVQREGRDSASEKHERHVSVVVESRTGSASVSGSQFEAARYEIDEQIAGTFRVVAVDEMLYVWVGGCSGTHIAGGYHAGDSPELECEISRSALEGIELHIAFEGE